MTAEARKAASLDQLIDEAWQALLDVDDRTSPEEYPDMALIKPDEFRGVITSFVNEALAALTARLEEESTIADDATEWSLAAARYQAQAEASRAMLAEAASRLERLADTADTMAEMANSSMCDDAIAAARELVTKLKGVLTPT